MNSTSLSKDPDYTLWKEIVTTREILIKARHQDIKKHDIPADQGAVLFLVLFLGRKATPAEISRLLYRKTHSTTEILNRMQKRGLIKRVHDLERKNMVRIELTKKARAICDEAMVHVHNIMSVLKEKERKQLLKYLRLLEERGLEELRIH